MEIKIETLGYFVDRLFTNMVKFLNYELSAAGLDLQHPQFSILMVLGKNDGVSQSELTTFIDRDKASVSRNIKYLENRGYIIKKKVMAGQNLSALQKKVRESFQKFMKSQIRILK